MTTKAEKQTARYTLGAVWADKLTSDNTRCVIDSSDGLIFSTIGATLNQGNANRLILCWNSHDELLEALKEAREEHDGVLKALQECVTLLTTYVQHDGGEPIQEPKVLEAARAAIAIAKKEKL